MALGEIVGEGRGKITTMRVLPDGKMEVSQNPSLWIQMNFYPNPDGPAKIKKSFKKMDSMILAKRSS
jgi:hypothetical protein